LQTLARLRPELRRQATQQLQYGGFHAAAAQPLQHQQPDDYRVGINPIVLTAKLLLLPNLSEKLQR